MNFLILSQLNSGRYFFSNGNHLVIADLNLSNKTEER